VFCKKCITKSILKNQHKFSTDDILKCPECNIELCDESWQKLSSLMVDEGLLKRKIVYNTYICPEYYSRNIKNINLNTEYSNINMDFINKTICDVVYFEKIKKNENKENKVYVILFGDQKIKEKFFDLQKELVEYVFHPSRIKNIEDLDNM
jgi:hypothetical protein